MGKTRAELQAMSVDELKAYKASLQPTPVTTTETPEFSSSPEELRKQLEGLPADRLKELKAQIDAAKSAGELSPKDQFGAVFRTILSRVTGGSDMTETGVEPGVSEKVISGLNALDTSGHNPNPPTGSLTDRIKGAVANITGKYDADRARGQKLIEKVGPGEAIGTPIRSALELPSFGASEPLISGVKAGFKAVQEGDFSTKNLVEKFREDVTQRNESKEKLPWVHHAAEAVGGAMGSVGLTRKAGAAAVEKAVPGTLAKVAKATALPKGAGFVRKAVQEVGGIAKEAAKGALDMTEQAVARRVFLEKPGFEKPGSIQDAASLGAKVSGGVRALGTVAKVLAPVGRGALAVFLGSNSKDIKYYVDNFDRLKNQEADIGKLSDSMMDAVDKIKNDFDTAKLSQQEAQRALDQLEASVRLTHKGKQYDLQQQLQAAKAEMDIAFREGKARLDMFRQHVPNHLVDDVGGSVKDLRDIVTQSHLDKLKVLTDSKEAVNLQGLTDTIDQAVAELKVDGGKAFGEAGRASAAKLGDYKRELLKLAEKFPDGIPAREAWKIVHGLDNDVNWAKTVPEMSKIVDGTLSRVRGDLQGRLTEAVPGYAQAVETNRAYGRMLDDAAEYFASPDQALNSLQNISSPQKYRVRQALLEIGEATGKDFNPIVSSADQASEILGSPRAQDIMKKGSAEAQRVEELQKQLQMYQDPRQAEQLNQQIMGQVNSSPQAANLAQAKGAVDATQKMNDLFKGFSDMTIESKIKAVVRGHEAMKGRFKFLSQLSNEDFMQAVNDMAALSSFNKTNMAGSRRVNMFTALGYAGASNADPVKRGTISALTGVLGGMVDQFGAPMARKILDSVGAVNGMMTEAKIMAMDLPSNIRNDLVSQLAKALYLGTQVDHDPVVTVGPEEKMLIRREIQNSNLSTIEKAKTISLMNEKSQVKGLRKLLIGNTPIPQEEVDQVPSGYDSVMEKMSSAGR